MARFALVIIDGLYNRERMQRISSMCLRETTIQNCVLQFSQMMHYYIINFFVLPFYPFGNNETINAITGLNYHLGKDAEPATISI